MVIYSTTNDKPVIGEMWERDFVKTRQKGILYITAKTPKNSSSCVSVEYSSQATSTNPHFFGSTPLPRWFLGGSGRFIYYCYNIILLWTELQFDFHYVIIKCFVGKCKKTAKNLHSGNRGNPHWTGEGDCTSSPKTRSKAVLLFNFFASRRADHSWKWK